MKSKLQLPTEDICTLKKLLKDDILMSTTFVHTAIEMYSKMKEPTKEELEDARKKWESLSPEEKLELRENHKWLISAMYDVWKSAPSIATPDPNYYYHVADLFCIPEIMKNGLQCGNDGNIWVYSDLITTNGICTMCSTKKNRANEKYKTECKVEESI